MFFLLSKFESVFGMAAIPKDVEEEEEEEGAPVDTTEAAAGGTLRSCFFDIGGVGAVVAVRMTKGLGATFGNRLEAAPMLVLLKGGAMYGDASDR